jgi:Asp-tRNA(Asn)/Glu-tRNA(Gln) amidotransferase A subunit family amidase
MACSFAIRVRLTCWMVAPSSLSRPSELPVGLIVWAGAMRDDTVLNIALPLLKNIAYLHYHAGARTH